MSSRSLLIRSVFCLVIATPLGLSRLWADDLPMPDVANSSFSSVGIVSADEALVRSGPGDSYYPTMKLSKGQKVTVVGIKFDWLKITPPEGSFCYVAKAHVERRADGSMGRITRDGVIVRAGSSLNTMKIVPLTELAVNTEVTILGEEDEYFKIAPPPRAYLYVDKQSVTPDPQAQPVAQNAGDAGGAGATATAEQGPATQPSTEPAAAAPEVDVQALAMKALFEKCEADFAAASTESLDQQPLAELMASYKALATSASSTAEMKRAAAIRLNTLKVRQEAAVEYAAVIKSQEALKQQQTALQAERQELEERLRTTGVINYAAVGQLQTSSLQVGAQMLYRLADPANGRTLCYVRTSDTGMAVLIGQFVGVKGEINTDDQLNLKVVAATDVTAVDPAKVNSTVAALLVPPSLLGKGTAQTPVDQR